MRVLTEADRLQARYEHVSSAGAFFGTLAVVVLLGLLACFHDQLYWLLPVELIAAGVVIVCFGTYLRGLRQQINDAQPSTFRQ